MKEEDIRNRKAFNHYLKMVSRDVDNYFCVDNFIKINCPACSGEKFTKAFTKDLFTYVLCNQCRTLFVNPRPQYEVLNQFYAKSPSTKYWVKYFFKPVMEARRNKIFKPRAEQISQKFPEFKNGRIGDIGAGFGLFLEELRKIWGNAEYVAIEPSVEMEKICREKGLIVIPDMLEDIKDWNEKFDVLTSFELFEHLYNPHNFLKKVNKLLKKGGYFIMTTLNVQGFDIQLLWEQSKSVSPPHHLNFFNPDSIRCLMEKNNFQVISIKTPGKLDWDIVEGMVKNENIKLDRFWQLIIEKDDKTKDQFQQWLVKNNLSSHMMVEAKKL
ncbi:MAG: class I SAM-dependent methyltransferase [Actinobacteria bacterium]|nr:class I SAM-dependent methyltransferase [Actinomycetota bacterium]